MKRRKVMKKKQAKHNTKKNKTHLKQKIIISFSIIVFLLIAFFAYQCYNYFLPNFNVKNGERVFIYITKETTFNDVVSQLTTQNAIKNVHSFKRWAKMHSYPKYIKTGRYEVIDGMSNKDLIFNLSRKIQTPIKFTFNNIRTKDQLCKRIDEQLMIDSATMHNTLDNKEILLKYNVSKEEVIAFFIPNTYEIYWDISATDLLARMYREYQKFWNKQRLEKAEKINLKPVQIATLASIIDEETNLKKDKSIIAGLYLNRLKRGMPLQACPTARFAVGDFSLTRILYEHTQFDSPYNTYRYKGLPPGPIRVASPEGIDAVLNYTKSNYLYMCAKETMNGEHNFASTLSEHNRNAQRYQKAYNQLFRKR